MSSCSALGLYRKNDRFIELCVPVTLKELEWPTCVATLRGVDVDDDLVDGDRVDELVVATLIGG